MKLIDNKWFLLIALIPTGFALILCTIKSKSHYETLSKYWVLMYEPEFDYTVYSTVSKSIATPCDGIFFNETGNFAIIKFGPGPPPHHYEKIYLNDSNMINVSFKDSILIDGIFFRVSDLDFINPSKVIGCTCDLFN